MNIFRNRALLPCPFCGGPAEFVHRDVEPQGDPWYGRKVEEFVECKTCSACLFDGYFHDGFFDKAKGIEAWNRRAAPSPSSAGTADPFNRKQVEAVCRAVCVVEGVDPDDTTFTGDDPPWTRYADAVAEALDPAQPSAGSATACEATEDDIAAVIVAAQTSNSSICAAALQQKFVITKRTGDATPLTQQPQYIVEGIILRRLHEKRIEGYTIETAKEIAEALFGDRDAQ